MRLPSGPDGACRVRRSLCRLRFVNVPTHRKQTPTSGTPSEGGFLAPSGHRSTSSHSPWGRGRSTPSHWPCESLALYFFGRSFTPAASRSTTAAIRSARTSGRRLVASIQRR